MLPSRDSRLIRIVLTLFFILLIGYALYEARGILYGPAINMPEEAIHVTEQSTLIRGRAERITELRLNGKQIPVTESGQFEETFLLAPGSNYFFLEARNARGRIAQKTLVIIYTPPETHSTTTPSNE